MLFTKSINEITWNDVENFCKEQKPEGFVVEYKRDFPKELEKQISAMANTFGGIIIIGIKENKETKPQFELTGIDYKEGLTEQITSISISNINPPIIPEVQVCTDSACKKAVIIIRVPQSVLSPHSVDHNTKVYIRNGNISSPEELATIDRVSWLTNSREKSRKLKSNLLTQAERRYKEFLLRGLGREISDDRKPINYEDGILTMSACPTFPLVSFKQPSELIPLPGIIQVKDFYGTDNYFPFKDWMNPSRKGTIVQDGIVLVSFQDKRIHYLELNSFGLYFYRQPIRRYRISEQGFPSILLGDEIIARVIEFLETATKLYKHISYHGNVEIEIKLAGILGMELDFEYLRGYPRGSASVDDELSVPITILRSDIGKRMNDNLQYVLKKLLWNFNLPEDDTLLERLKKAFKIL